MKERERESLQFEIAVFSFLCWFLSHMFALRVFVKIIVHHEDVQTTDHVIIDSC